MTRAGRGLAVVVSVSSAFAFAFACTRNDTPASSAPDASASASTFVVPVGGGSTDVVEPSGTTLTFTFDAALAGLVVTLTPVDGDRVSWPGATGVREGVLLDPAGTTLATAAHVRSSRATDVVFAVAGAGASRVGTPLLPDGAGGFAFATLGALAVADASSDDAASASDAPSDAASNWDGDVGPLCPDAIDMTPGTGIVPPADPTAIPLPADAGPGVDGGDQCGNPPTLRAYTFLAPTQVTMWKSDHMFAYFGALGCDVPCGQGPLTCLNGHDVHSTLVQPGRHYVAFQGFLGYSGNGFLFEVPPPPPTNTTLATATPLVNDNTVHTFDRIVDTQPRVYSFVHNRVTTVFLEPTNCGGAWHAPVVDCASGAPIQGGGPLNGECELGNSGTTWADADASAQTGSPPPPTPAGTYCIVITADPGVKLGIEYIAN